MFVLGRPGFVGAFRLLLLFFFFLCFFVWGGGGGDGGVLANSSPSRCLKRFLGFFGSSWPAILVREHSHSALERQVQGGIRCSGDNNAKT